MERYGTGIFLGAGRDKHFGFSVEVRYADKNMAESFNCLPTTGRLPEKENEVALSSTILAVSYTHLDVYKRQVSICRQFRHFLEVICKLKKEKIKVYLYTRVSVSYTHLDVYKRQNQYSVFSSGDSIPKNRKRECANEAQTLVVWAFSNFERNLLSLIHI